MHETNKIDPVRVNVSLGYKINTGNYESFSVSVSVSDSARNGETATALVDRVYSFTEGQLVEKVTKAREELSAG
jgi:hypothetical protein